MGNAYSDKTGLIIQTLEKLKKEQNKKASVPNALDHLHVLISFLEKEGGRSLDDYMNSFKKNYVPITPEEIEEIKNFKFD